MHVLKYLSYKLSRMFQFTLVFRELCLKKPSRKKQDSNIVHVIRQLAEIMLGNNVLPKYSDPRSPIIGVSIKGSLIKNALIDLGAAINVTTKKTIDDMQLNNIRSIPTVLNYQIGPVSC